MPLEIRELHIRVVLNSEPTKSSLPAKSTSDGGAAADKDAIVAECVEQVLEILRAKRER